MPKRCSWVNLNSELAIKYHDEEWGKKVKYDQLLWEYLVLECFQSGLSWNCVLNKRSAMRLAFASFNPHLIAQFSNKEISNLLNNSHIIRHQGKIKATINNAKLFICISKQYNGFINYLNLYASEDIDLMVTKLTIDLKKKGFKYIGTTLIKSYLQAIGFIPAHDSNCFLNNKRSYD